MAQRTQITLEPELHRKARQRASELGVSLAGYFRSLVRRDLGEEARSVHVTEIFDLGDSGGSEIARHKHEYVGDAVDSLHSRR